MYLIVPLRDAGADMRWRNLSYVMPVEHGWYIMNSDGTREGWTWLWYERWQHRVHTPFPPKVASEQGAMFKLK